MLHRSTVILGTGSYAPDRILTNADLAKMVDTSDEWIRARSGIRERRIAGPNEATSDMAVQAGRRALEDAGVAPSEIDLLVVATVTPDYPMPSTACIVQHKLGLPSASACFDLNAACSGFIYALDTACAMITSGRYKKALVIGAEKLSSVVDWKDRGTCMLFGDGAGAAVVGAGTKPGIGLIGTRLGSLGEDTDLLLIPAGGSLHPSSAESVKKGDHFIKMKGKEVFKLAVRVMEEAARDILEQHGLTATQIGLVIPHQANLAHHRSHRAVPRAPGGEVLRERGPLREHVRRLDPDRARRGPQGGPNQARRPHASRRFWGRLDLWERPDSLVISALMPTPFPRRSLLPMGIAAVLALTTTSRLAADLVWTPSTGWQVEQGALSGLSPQQGRSALELMNRARKDEEDRSKGSAIKEYEKVASKYSSSVYAPEALYRAAKLYQSRSQFYLAFGEFQNLLRRYPNTKRFNDVIGEQYRIASSLLNGKHNRMFGGTIPGFSNRTKAIEFFEYVVLNAPYSDYAPLALMDIARGEEYIKNSDEAIDALDRLVNTYPQSVLAAVAYLRLGDLHASLSQGPMYDQASTKEAMTYYEDFMILYPGDANIAQAASGVDRMKTILSRSKIYIGDFYFYKRQNYRAARVFYNEAITAYPESPPATLAKKRLAEVTARMAQDAVGSKNPPKKRFWLF